MTICPQYQPPIPPPPPENASSTGRSGSRMVKEDKNSKLQPDYNKVSDIFKNISGNETIRGPSPYWTDK